MRDFKKRYPEFKLYEKSINRVGDKYIFLASKNNEKFVVVGDSDFKFFFAFKNINIILENLPFLKPIPCGLKNSFGFGDRLGISTPGHIRAVKEYNFFPLFAQQSVRELERTGRTFKDVIDSAILGCFQEGYKDGFGADADHIKEIQHLKQAIDANFTFFTIDPSDKIHNPIVFPPEEKKTLLTKHLPEYEKIYLDREYHIGKATYHIDSKHLEEFILTYIEAIDHIEECYRFLKGYLNTFDFEVSVDETSVSTTPLAHIFIVEELKRREIEFQSIAFRFPGRFEKGIDYKGNIEEFEKILLSHQSIREEMGNYKLSLHSGSDKLSIYLIFRKILGDKIHIKTSGTSWIEAVKLVALKDFPFFLEILDCCIKNFKKNSASYEISARPELIDFKNIEKIPVENLFQRDDIRQIIHIGYGTLLTAKDSDGNFLYKRKFLNIVHQNEEEYYNLLKAHLYNHLRLLR